LRRVEKEGVVLISILLLSFLAGLVTGVGALIAVFIKNPSKKALSFSLGFASGIMLGISTLSLIPESVTAGDLATCFAGIVGGAAFLWLVDMLLPHIHKTETERDIYMKLGSFIALGIAFHNLPEGIAIGASNQVSAQLGFYTAFSIGIHNIAEGLSVAMPLCLGKMDRMKIVFITTLTGLATLGGTVLGSSLVSVSGFFISVSLAFAAGAMIYIVSDELIPLSHHAHSHFANIGIVLGIIMALGVK
jgi:ZIP family zinc transporter